MHARSVPRVTRSEAGQRRRIAVRRRPVTARAVFTAAASHATLPAWAPGATGSTTTGAGASEQLELRFDSGETLKILARFVVPMGS